MTARVTRVSATQLPGQAYGRLGPHVVVVGGGLAGITAAIAVRDTGARVTLVEARPRLGGATSSFSRDGLTVDNGQHVFLRCCTAYQGLLARLGMSGAVAMQERFDVTVLAPGGRRGRLRRSGLPGPLHMTGALAAYPFLTPAQRLRAARAALAMAALDPAAPGTGARRLGDWLAARGQDERARRVLWDLFTVSALNVDGDEADLGLAATVVKTALLGAKDAADIGVAAVPLGDLHGRAAAALLTRMGAHVRVGAKVTAIELAPGGGFRVRLRGPGRTPDIDAGPGGHAGLDETGSLDGTTSPDGAGLLDGTARGPGPDGGGRQGGTAGGLGPAGGEQPGAAAPAGAGTVLHADGLVLAVPPEAAAGLTPPGAAADGPGPAHWRRLGASPIVNVHVVYERRVTRLPFVAAVDSPVQWVFDRTGPAGLRTGQYLAVSLSAADSYVNLPAARLRELFEPALAELFPAARDTRVADFFVTRERRATMRQAMGCGRLRPPAATALPGLVLAGAWTDTGWPDTMEGAVRSGLNAARELRRHLAAASSGLAGGLGPPRPAGPDGEDGGWHGRLPAAARHEETA